MALDASVLPFALGAGTSAAYAWALRRSPRGRAWRMAGAGALTSIMHVAGVLTGLWIEGSLLAYGAMLLTSAIGAVALQR